MALNLGERLKELWKLQPWYLWAGEGAAVAAIAYVAWSSHGHSAAAVNPADTTVSDASLTTPPGEAPGTGIVPGVPPPSGTLPPTPIPPSPPASGPPPPGVNPPPYMPPGGLGYPSGNFTGPGVPAQPLPPRQTPGHGGGGDTHPFVAIDWPAEMAERLHTLTGHTGLPFHTAGEY